MTVGWRGCVHRGAVVREDGQSFPPQKGKVAWYYNYQLHTCITAGFEMELAPKPSLLFDSNDLGGGRGRYWLVTRRAFFLLLWTIQTHLCAPTAKIKQDYRWWCLHECVHVPLGMHACVTVSVPAQVVVREQAARWLSFTPCGAQGPSSGCKVCQQALLVSAFFFVELIDSFVCLFVLGSNSGLGHARKTLPRSYFLHPKHFFIKYKINKQNYGTSRSFNKYRLYKISTKNYGVIINLRK